MSNLIFAVESIKYGTATGSNTMPASGDLTALPDTVKGSITLEEGEGAIEKFMVDQKSDPIKVLKTEEGEVSLVAQFYDLTYATIAAIKGGTGDASGYTPSTGFSQVEKALEITLESGHVFDFYNAYVSTRILGGGGRDSLFMMEMKAWPQITDDEAGSWKVRPE